MVRKTQIRSEHTSTRVFSGPRSFPRRKWSPTSSGRIRQANQPLVGMILSHTFLSDTERLFGLFHPSQSGCFPAKLVALWQARSSTWKLAGHKQKNKLVEHVQSDPSRICLMTAIREEQHDLLLCAHLLGSISFFERQSRNPSRFRIQTSAIKSPLPRVLQNQGCALEAISFLLESTGSAVPHFALTGSVVPHFTLTGPAVPHFSLPANLFFVCRLVNLWTPFLMPTNLSQVRQLKDLE